MQEQAIGEPGVWGARFSMYGDSTRSRKGVLPTGCPDWAKWQDVENWRKAGLACWNHSDQQLGWLSGVGSLELLRELQSCSDYDLPITLFEVVYVAHLDPPKPVKRSRRKSKLEVAEVDSSAIAPDKRSEVKRERHPTVSLPATSLAPLRSYLEVNEAQIARLAEREKEEGARAMQNVIEILLEVARRGQPEKIDLTKREVPWVYDPGCQSFICNVPPNRATVIWKGGSVYWQVDLECPGKPVSEIRYFHSAEEALDEAENQIKVLSQPEPPRSIDRPLDDWIREIKKAHSAVWRSPKLLLPKHPTFEVVIEFELPYKTHRSERMSFDGYQRIGDQRYSVSEAEAQLQLPVGYFEIFDSEIPELGYRAKSVTSFRDRSLALNEAARIWNGSRILQRFREGFVRRARYGVNEREIGYRDWVGECAKSDWSFHAPDRDKHMLSLAARTALLAAMDIKRYRAFMGMSEIVWDDERLATYMHERRAVSQLLPERLREESANWLAKKKPTESAQPSDKGVRRRRRPPLNSL